MFRVLNLVSVLALLAAAGAVYHVKYSSVFEAQEIAKLRDDIRAERDRIAILNAEWARRTSPSRIQTLAEHHLGMQMLDADRISTLASLPAKAERNDDALGGMIEALVDAPGSAPITAPGELKKPDAFKLPKPAATPSPAKPQATGTPAAKPAPARVPAPSAPQARDAGQPRTPLPLSAMPPAGTVAPRMAGPSVPAPAQQPMVSAPVTSNAPFLPPGLVGQ